ncbi:MAG: Txe/YoeB family addiction module toxin [Ignavibacteriae bacterium]|nr:Txe/YoeB family addiction module toxin [Ignavibacteriota bacterium]
MRTVSFHSKAFNHFIEWSQTDKRIFERIILLIRETLRSPFDGIGKPEPLKHEFQGCWSRRINDEHRLVYQVTETTIMILSCKYHY